MAAFSRGRSRTSERTFIGNVLRSATYPLARQGLFIVIGGAVLFTLLDLLAAWSWMFGVVAIAMSLGYAIAYYSRIVASSSNGDDALPDWQEYANFWEDILYPIGRVAFVAVMSMAPAGVLYAAGERELLWIAAVGTLLFYTPLAWMAVSLYDSVWAANPVRVARYLFTSPLQAAVASAIFCATVTASVGLRYAFSGSIAGMFVGYLGGLYLMFVAMRVLGLFYFHNRQVFDR